MLILKIMSSQDLPDADPAKEFKLISDVHSVQFFTHQATDFEEKLLGYKAEGRRHFCTMLMPNGKTEDWVGWDSQAPYLKKGGIIADHWYQKHPGGDRWPIRKEWLTGEYPKTDGIIVPFARVCLSSPNVPGGKFEEVHLLTGNCYILNDRGKTIETFWARRTRHSDKKGGRE